ncbi:MAG: hypothetical protein ABSC14_10205 [Desulfomonilia bacterium]|jgi:hypothetical protein
MEGESITFIVYTKGIFHHEEYEGHEEKNPLEITDRGKGFQECPFPHFLDLFRALRILRGENNGLGKVCKP